MSSNRRANASRRKKGIYTRQELIKKHGLATFHPDPDENRKLQETKGKDIDFREQYGVEAVSYTHLTLPTNREV